MAFFALFVAARNPAAQCNTQIQQDPGRGNVEAM